MSLLTDAMTECYIINKAKVDDGYGGYTTKYIKGATFNAAIVFDTSLQARTAEKQGVSSLYTVTTSRSMTLEYHDIFQRVSDGKVLRVTSDGDDKYTPASTALDMRQVTAEEFSLTGSVEDGQSTGNS